MAPRKPELFQDVLEDEGGRANASKQRVGGASLRPEEFSGGRPQEDVVDRFNILQAEEQAFRNQAHRASSKTRRFRWTGTFWLLGIFAALALAAVGYGMFSRYRQQLQQQELARATAARRMAEEERKLAMKKLPAPTSAAVPAAPAPSPTSP